MFERGFVLAGILALGLTLTALAEDAAKKGMTTESTPMPASTESMMMDQTQMHSMMQECMKENKDGKMCETQMMEQCRKGKGQGECSKMMKGIKPKSLKY